MAHLVLDYAPRSVPSPLSYRADFVLLVAVLSFSATGGIVLVGLAAFGDGYDALAALGAGVMLMFMHLLLCVLPTLAFLILNEKVFSRRQRRLLIVMAAAGMILPAAAVVVAVTLPRAGGLPL